MVEVFKTNVLKESEADRLIRGLVQHFPLHKINFDLEDCDKILRVEGTTIAPEKIIDFLESLNYRCALLK